VYTGVGKNMATFTQWLVDIPEDKGIHMKTAGAKGEKYVYKYVRYYRNEDGNPRNQAKAIGKFDPASGQMFPNNHYFELYHIDPIFINASVLDYGYSFLVLKVCQDMGLMENLFQSFGSHAMDIVVMAAYIIREGNSMDGLDDWQSRNYFPDFNRLLSSQATSRLFASFTPQQRENFFKLWVKTASSDGSVCYDVTSISSYSQDMPTVERGYNRDGDNLSQFNLGMFCDENSKVPLYYNRYNGSLTDKTNLSHVMANAKAVGINRVKMVLDGGFWNKGCFPNLHDTCEAFTIGMPLHLKESQQLLDSYGKDVEKYANELQQAGIYCISVDMTISGIFGRALMYYDSFNYFNQCITLSETIVRLRAELSKLKRYPKNKLGRYTPYFVLTKHEHDSGFEYEADHEKIEKIRSAKGYFLIFSTDRQSSPSDILDHYRAKDADEKLFAQIKVDMDGRRIRTHNEETTDGKTFVTFIACLIRAYILNKLTKYLMENATSMKKVWNQLSDITIISNHEGYRFTKALTKKQKQILEAFDAEKDILYTLKK
jgi:hypothetical protein